MANGKSDLRVFKITEYSPGRFAVSHGGFETLALSADEVTEIAEAWMLGGEEEAEQVQDWLVETRRRP